MTLSVGLNVSYRPTDEQLHARECFATKRPLKITAFAGAGKTTTLHLLAESRTTRGAYLAFNRSIATEAAEKFPKTVDCRTTHSIAWQAVKSAHRFSTGKMKDSLHAKQLAEILSFQDRTFGGEIRLTGVHQAYLLLRTLRNFEQSADAEIGQKHVPQYGRLLGASEITLGDVRAWAISTSNMLWGRMINHRDPIPLGHDGYLKLWALGRPRLGYEYILLDEAQDTNPVVLGVLDHQSAQIVYVGDRHQQIYEWRGAINAMEKIGGCSEAYLTQSFRFGDAIAQAASQVLHTLGENKSVRGNPVITSTITHNGRADTVLARTNATVILEVLEAMNANLRACVVGGTGDLKRLLSDVYELKNNKPGTCPEFFGFRSWDEVVAFSETEEGEEIRTFVQLVQQHGESKLWAAVCSAVSEENQANIVLSTAHKAKGREWDSVRLAPDFLSSRLDGTDPKVESEVRLFYVGMTRAKRHLSVEPEMLATFSSGGWKARRPDHQQRSMNFSSETSGSSPSSPEEHRERKTESRRSIIVREISSECVRRRHPGSASYSPPVTAYQSNEETIASSPAGDALASDHLESRPAPAKPRRWWQIWK